jgi:hypothetical protein
LVEGCATWGSPGARGVKVADDWYFFPSRRLLFHCAVACSGALALHSYIFLCFGSYALSAHEHIFASYSLISSLLLSLLCKPSISTVLNVTCHDMHRSWGLLDPLILSWLIDEHCRIAIRSHRSFAIETLPCPRQELHSIRYAKTCHVVSANLQSKVLLCDVRISTLPRR